MTTFSQFGVYFRWDQSVLRSAQKPPFDAVSPYGRYSGVYAQSVAPNLVGAFPYDASQFTYRYSSSLMSQASNEAYEKFRGKIYDKVGLGVDFAEYRQSLSMMARTCGTLFKAALQIRKFDFLDAAKTLRMHFVPKGVSVKKSFSNNWLEFHFGWEPLVKDIYESVEVLNNPLKAFELVRGKRQFVLSESVIENTGSTSRVLFPVSSYTVYQGGRVSAITDRGLHSLDQFGVLNPAEILWELVPFSFVVDWFANVGQVLSSFSDFAGMTLKDTYTTRKYTISYWGMLRDNVTRRSIYTVQMSGQFTTRAVGLTTPVLNVKRLRLPSSTRAVTALSLLIQQLSQH